MSEPHSDRERLHALLAALTDARWSLQRGLSGRGERDERGRPVRLDLQQRWAAVAAGRRHIRAAQMILAGWLDRGQAGDEVAARLDSCEHSLAAALDGDAALLGRLVDLGHADRQARWALTVLGSLARHGEIADYPAQRQAPPDAENTPGAGGEQG